MFHYVVCLLLLLEAAGYDMAILAFSYFIHSLRLCESTRRNRGYAGARVFLMSPVHSKGTALAKGARFSLQTACHRHWQWCLWSQRLPSTGRLGAGFGKQACVEFSGSN